ncbi:hypothetical protein BX600DRAFT_517759 [Xylariales sp. PMI_506]|nr:hypothetical protein BX600DRAFT_517759 [Xylariales sp. PMI_506]
MSSPQHPSRRSGTRPTRVGAPSSTDAAVTATTKARVKARGLVWTGAFAAITIVATMFGAGLRTQQEYKAEKQQILEYTAEERIKDLETRRAALVSQKIPLELKIKNLHEKIKAREEAEAKTANMSPATQSSKK